MKLIKLVCCVTLLTLLGGCGSILTPSPECRPLSAFDAIIISPVASDETIVEENKYNQLPPKIAALSTTFLKENIEDSNIFKHVSTSSECTSGAIKIDSKIATLIHHNGEFHATIRGSIVECKTGNTLYRFKEVWSEKDSALVAEKYANDISRSIKKNLVCK